MKLAIAAALVLGALATPVLAQEKSVEFVCSAPAGHTCQFAIKTAQGPVSFALPSGQKKRVDGVTPRADKYCVCDPGPVNESCTAPEVGKWCLGYWQDVVPGINSRLEVGSFPVAGN